MEPAGFAVGLIGLAGLFSSCLEAVDRVQSYKSFASDSNALEVQFDATKLHLENWGRSVGLVDWKLSTTHHPALADEKTRRTAGELLTLIKNIFDPQNARNQPRVAPIDDLSGSHILLESPGAPVQSRRRRLAWSLGGKLKRTEQVSLLKELVQSLHNLVPPDAVHGARSLHLDKHNPMLKPGTEPSPGLTLSADFRRLIAQLEAKTRRELYAWLRHVPDERYNDSIERRLDGTCLWILDRPVFIEWESPEFRAGAKVLWIHGPAGFGKTVLCANIVQHLTSTLKSAVAHFFISSDSDSREDPFMAIRSWISQVVSIHEEAFESALQGYEADLDPTATRYTIMSLFASILRIVPGCTFVIDGVDECTHLSGTNNSVTHFLRNLMNAAAGTNTRILIVSRFLTDVRYSLRDHDADFSEYQIDPADVRSDIAAYSRALVEKKLPNKHDDVRASLSDSMAKRCEGQFLWLKLQGDALRKGMSPKSLQRTIDSTPTELSRVYDHSWKRIIQLGDEDMHRAFAILRWAAFSLRPLRVDELSEAVLIDDSGDLSFDDLPEPVDDDYVESEIIELCGPLLELKSDPSDPSPAQRTVHLPHFTVKEYLLCNLPLPGWLTQYDGLQAPERINHTLLANACLHYISLPDAWALESATTTNATGMSFRHYASTEWYRHWNSGIRHDLLMLANSKRFFAESNRAWTAWVALLEGEDQAIQTPCDPLSYAVKLQLPDLALSLIQDKTFDIKDIIDGQSPALILAARSGALKIIGALLERGADIGTTINGFDFSAPLFEASINGHVKVVKLLLENGADIMATNESKCTVIYAASYSGHVDVVKFLLENGADLTIADDCGRTPLHGASLRGHVEAAKLLLERDADLTVMDMGGCTPLHLASFYGHVELVKLFLDNNADPTVKSKELWDPLRLASFHGYGEVVQLLLDSVADAAATITSEYSPIFVASENGHVEVVKLLLERGADAAAPVKSGYSPIHVASQNGHVEVVKLLLESGVDTAAMTMSGYSPIYLASQNGHVEVVKLLLERGADAAAPVKSGCSPIYLASQNGHVEVVKLLLESGVDAAAMTMSGYSLIHVASENGHLEVVKLLLSSSPRQVNCGDPLDRTPLFLASRAGHVEVVRHILDHADTLPSIMDWLQSTALSTAVRNGHVAVVELLLGSRRFNIDEEDAFGRDLAWWARRTGKSELVALLMDHAERTDNLLFDEDDPSAGLSALFQPDLWWCDACTLDIPSRTGFSCDVCCGGGFCLCDECYGMGYKCLDHSHKLLPVD